MSDHFLNPRRYILLGDVQDLESSSGEAHIGKEGMQ